MIKIKTSDLNIDSNKIISFINNSLPNSSPFDSVIEDRSDWNPLWNNQHVIAVVYSYYGKEYIDYLIFLYELTDSFIEEARMILELKVNKRLDKYKNVKNIKISREQNYEKNKTYEKE